MTLLHQAAQKAVEARQGFEEWMRRVHPQHSLERTNYPGDHGEGDYVEGRTHDKWQTWQSALQQQEVPREPVAEWLDDLEADISAIDCRYRGDPSYDHDAYWMKDRVLAVIERHRGYLATSPSTTQQQEVGNGWRSIESAPKDGTEILVWRDDAGAFMAMWTCVNDLRTTSDKDRDELDEDTLFSYDWFGGDAEGNFRCDGSEAPTHWQPMPAAPSTPESAEKDDAGGGKVDQRG